MHEGTAGLQIVLQERFVEGLAVDHPYLMGRLNLAGHLGAYQQPYFPHGTIVVLEVGHQLGKQRIGLVRQSATANLLTGKLGSVHQHARHAGLLQKPRTNGTCRTRTNDDDVCRLAIIVLHRLNFGCKVIQKDNKSMCYGNKKSIKLHFSPFYRAFLCLFGRSLLLRSAILLVTLHGPTAHEKGYDQQGQHLMPDA